MSFVQAAAVPRADDALYRRLLFATFFLGALVFYW